MKITANHLIGIGFATFFIAVLVYGHSITPGKITVPKDVQSGTQSTELLGSDEIIATPDIDVYSKGSTAIVEGTVESVQIGPTANYATLNLGKILKGDASLHTLNVMFPNHTSTEDSLEASGVLNVGENVLLFLGVDSQGNYVIAGSYAGKCLIDVNGNVTGQAAFSMPLTDLEAKIIAALNN